MMFRFFADKPREIKIARDWRAGVEAHGHQCEMIAPRDYQGPFDDTDFACVWGVAGKSRQIMNDHRRIGCRTIFMDKGYVGPANRTKYLKVSMGGFQPSSYFMAEPLPIDRWERIASEARITVNPMRNGGEAIIYAGPSQKNATFHGLGDANLLAAQTLRSIRRWTKRTVIYRPKPSWKGAAELLDAETSTGPLVDDLNRARIYLVQNSGSAVHALAHGVPVITLGDGITRPMGGIRIKDIKRRTLPDEDARRSFFAAVGYCMWTVDEMASGECWQHLERYVGHYV